MSFASFGGGAGIFSSPVSGAIIVCWDASERAKYVQRQCIQAGRSIHTREVVCGPICRRYAGRCAEGEESSDVLSTLAILSGRSSVRSLPVSTVATASMLLTLTGGGVRGRPRSRLRDHAFSIFDAVIRSRGGGE